MHTFTSAKTDDGQRLKFLVDTIAEMVWEADLKGKIVYANKALYDYMGKNEGDNISTAWLDATHPEDLAVTRRTWRSCLRSGKPFEMEFRLKSPDGDYEWFLARAMPYVHKGVTERWYGTCTSIDSKKLNEQLLAMSRSKDEFISIASHQLRTPATGVKQYLGMLIDGMFGDLNESQLDILNRANESNERQIRIISDLLKVAQVDSGEVMLHPVTADLSEIVHYIIQDISGIFKHRSQQLEYRPFKGDALAYIDIETIRMVIENLIDNASKYSEEGSKISVSVKQKEDVVQVIVADDGVGIADEDRHRLFERFSRIENPLSTKVGGTGLGLYWAKKIIVMHNGKITHSPNNPKGSIFTIELPRK